MKRVSTLGDIEKRLEDAGVQPTAQRIAIAHFVLGRAEHPTAEDVKKWADKNFPKMSFATVYNTLGILVRAKLLKEVKLPHTGRTVYDNNMTSHYHFLDEKSGKVFDIDPKDVEIRPRLRKGFSINSVEVLLRGTCK